MGAAIHYTGDRIGTQEHARCAGTVKGIQSYHMDSQGWQDIAYNALVCQHGFVFAGRGPGVVNGANGQTNANRDWPAICYLGGDGDPLTEAGKIGIWEAAEWLGVADAEWRPHRSFVSTSCPGDEVLAWLDEGHPRPGGRDEPSANNKRAAYLKGATAMSENVKILPGENITIGWTPPNNGPTGDVWVRLMAGNTCRVDYAVRSPEGWPEAKVEGTIPDDGQISVQMPADRWSMQVHNRSEPGPKGVIITAFIGVGVRMEYAEGK